MRFFWHSFLFGPPIEYTLTGGPGNEFIFGLSRADVVSAGDGDDYVSVHAGADIINLGAGDDTLFAGLGNDVILTGAGNDAVHGEDGLDTVLYDGAVADYAIVINSAEHATITFRITPHSGTDSLFQVEAAYFAADDYTLFLDGSNNAVLAADDAVATGENTGLSLTQAELLANDREFDGDTMTLIAVSALSASGATVTLQADGLTYDPGTAFDALAQGEVAYDSFTYTVDDGKGAHGTATVTVTITGENDAPEVTALKDVRIAENSTLVAAQILASDIDSTSVSFALDGVDAQSFVIDSETGDIAFVTAPDFETPGDSDSDNVYDITLRAQDDAGALARFELSVTVEDVLELPEVSARINELHYDDIGPDDGEFIEIRVAAGDDVSFLNVDLVNGATGTRYGGTAVAGLQKESDDAFDYYVWRVPDIGNGAADGIVLANGPDVLEFLSYEGSMTPETGLAAGVTSVDIGVVENDGTPEGLSLQREEDGHWTGPRAATPGAENIVGLSGVIITEIMRNPSVVADSSGEWFELFNPGATAVDINGWTVSDNDNDSFTIAQDTPLYIHADGYVVLGLNGDSATNGGVVLDYVYDGMQLSNVSDELVVTDALNRLVDRVGFDGGAMFPSRPGSAMALMDPALDNSVGAHWEDARVSFGNGDLGTPGAANAVEVSTRLVITEIMQNPFLVSDSAGEWFEVFNAGAEAVDVSGWTVSDNGNDRFVIDTDDPLVIAAGGFLVFGNNPDSASNGGVVLDFAYSGMFLSNNSDELVLTDASGSEVDRVEWDGGPTFPNPEGGSMALLDPRLDNEEGAHWVTGEASYGDGDLGTPGAVNIPPEVPELVISEIMQNPEAVGDGLGEWFEIYNAGVGRVDLTGWTVSDSGTDSFVVDTGAPLEVAPGAYFVLGNNANLQTNGGVALDYAYSGMFLSNGADELVLTAPDGTEMDHVAWDGGPNFPDPAGAAMALIDLASDNSRAGSWGTATAVYGDGDLGTPGAPNDDGDGLAQGDAGATLQVGAFNVLNYFTPSSAPAPLSARAPASVFDPAQQTDTLVAAMEASWVDVFALQEIQNNGFGAGSTIQTLTDAMSLQTGGNFAVVDPTKGAGSGIIGTDALTTGIVYDTSKVTLIDSAALIFADPSAEATFAVADTLARLLGVDGIEDAQRNRPATIATFEDIARGETFTVASVHFKSKAASGLDSLVDTAKGYLNTNAAQLSPAQVTEIKDAIAAVTHDPNYDQGDGQGYWNQVRTDAAGELYDFLGTRYRGSGTEDYVIVGDFNALGHEDPMHALAQHPNTVDVLDVDASTDAFDFVFDDARDSLDQVIATTGLAEHVTTLANWHINAYAPSFPNNNAFHNQEFYSDDLFAASDQTPLILGLDF